MRVLRTSGVSHDLKRAARQFVLPSIHQKTRIMSNLIPCPINEKDLCSDVLFDCLFDNDIYCEGERNTLVGFLNGGVTTAKYTEGSNVATLRFLERPINELDKEQIERINSYIDEVKSVFRKLNP